MTKLLLWLLPLFVLANQITLEHPQMKPLGKIIQTNAEITQLSDQKQEIVSRLSGHVEAYFVKSGDRVKSGDKVVLIESIELSQMTASYLALTQQVKAAKVQLSASRKLYKRGLTSQHTMNNNIIALEKIRSKQNALASQLESLGLRADTLSKATDQLILYAHADGIVGQILVSLHSNVDPRVALMTLVDQSGYYAIAYLSVEDAMRVSPETTGWLSIGTQQYLCHFVQLLPEIDKKTQRAKVLFGIEKNPENLLLGAYTQIELSLPPKRKVMMIKKSALTLFNGEWVVFVKADYEDKKEHEHHEGEHEDKHHTDSKYDELEEYNAEDDHDSHDEHENHNEHEEEKEFPYTIKVVKISATMGKYVAVDGIELDEEYVSEGVYFVKSMKLKSSLGGHGH